jgi:hypothetical protein
MKSADQYTLEYFRNMLDKLQVVIQRRANSKDRYTDTQLEKFSEIAKSLQNCVEMFDSILSE